MLLGLLANLATNTVKVASAWWVVTVWAGLGVTATVVALLQPDPARRERRGGYAGQEQPGTRPAAAQVSIRGNGSVAIGGDNHGDIAIH